MNTTIRESTNRTSALGALLALTLLGCGGGGDESADSPDATAQLWRRKLSLSLSVNAGGTVISSPLGINCTSQSSTGCDARFARSTVVALAAVPDAGYSFGGWGGTCEGTSCSVTMDTSHSVTATFNAIAAAAPAPPPAPAPAPAPSPAPPGTYSTTFDLNENPLSEGGRWLHTDSTLTVCKTVGGRAFGTQSGNGSYDDSNAYLTGYGNDHEVEGTVWLDPALSGSGHREVEILLRWTDTGPLRSTAYGPTRANGYEINVNHAGNYMQLGRFKGALLTQVDNFAVPKTGDRFRARIEGQRIRVWWNDVLKIDFTDTDAMLQITSGNPGIGFFVDGGSPNTDFGFDAISIRSL